MNATKSIFLLLFVSISCLNVEETSNSQLEVIDVFNAYKHRKDLKLNTVVDQVEYLALETSTQSMTGQHLRVYLTPRYVVAISFRKMQLFERGTGKYIRTVSECGKGPDEYRNTKIQNGFDEDQQLFYADGWGNKLLSYNLEGKLIEKIKIVNPNNSYSTIHIPIDSVNYVGYIPNTICEDTILLYTFNNNKKIIKTFRNYYDCEKDPKVFRIILDGIFYKFNKMVYYKDVYNDTLFQVKVDSLISRYKFNLDKYTPPYQKKFLLERQELVEYMQITNLRESDRFLFFKLLYQAKKHFCYYDKSKKEINISNYNALIDDINGFIPISPKSINNNGEMVSYIEAMDIVDWFNDNQDKVGELPPNLKKFQNIKETDNPVIVIGKLIK